MTLQDRFDTCLDLLKEKGGMTQRDVSDYLIQKGHNFATPIFLSRAKSKFEGTRTEDRTIPQWRLETMVKELEVLLETMDIVLVDGAYYKNRKTLERFNCVNEKNKKRSFPQGLVKLHDKLPRAIIQDAIANGKKVRLLQTFMTSMEDYIEAFEKCLLRGGHIQLLLLDPRGAVAKARSRGVKEKAMNVEEKVVQNLRMLGDLKYSSDQLEIKFYDDLPGLEMFAIDDRIFCGWYLFKQLAKDGAYLELENNDRCSLPNQVNKNWRELWAQANLPDYGDNGAVEGQEYFKCHYIRYGEYNHFDMRINRLSTEVFFTNTSSSNDFKGHFENENGRFLSISAETVIKKVQGKFQEINKRIASFLIYTGHNGLWDQAFSVGVFTNMAPNGMLYANIVLIENLRTKFQLSKSPKDAAKKLLKIKQFLKSSELRANDIPDHNLEGLENYLQFKHPQWLDLYRRSILISGQFYLYYQLKVDSGKNCLHCRPVVINGAELKAKRKVWKEDRIKIYDVLIPDSSQLLLKRIHPNILDSECISLSRRGPAMDRFCGHMFTINREGTNLVKAFIIRNEAELGEEDYVIEYDSPKFAELCQQKDFKTHFLGD